MGDNRYLQTGSLNHLNHLQVNSAFRPFPFRVPTCLAKVKAGRVYTCVSWQVTLCNFIWQVTLHGFKMGFLQRATG